ncbi:TIR domain-containing protein, partial [Phormidesmis sp. 146-33]
MSESAVLISGSARNRVDHDVFISYSRRDGEFARRLLGALKGENRDTWVDWQSIQAAEDFWQAIETGIEAANTFIFVISPDSVASEYCNKEVDYAVLHKKRLIPVVCREAGDVHSALRSLDWIFLREQDDFEPAFARLVKAIDTDLEHTRSHTRLLVKAIEWNKRGRDDSFLLRKIDLTDAEYWLTASTEKEPIPTELHRNYITTSRKVEDDYNLLLAKGERALQRVRLAAIVVPVAAVSALALGIYSAQVSTELAQKKQNIRDVWHFTDALADSAKGNYDSALDRLATVIERNPRSTFALMGRGYVFLQMRNYAASEAEFRRAIQIDQNDPTAWLGLSNALKGQDKPDEAIAAL